MRCVSVTLIWLVGFTGACAVALGDGARSGKPALRATPTVKSAPLGASLPCVYPWRAAAAGAGSPLRGAPFAESEPNGDLASADVIPLDAASPAFDVAGSLTLADVDLYRVEVQAGQWLNAAMVAPTTPDSKIAVLDASGAVLLSNDDDGLSEATSQSGSYPVASPLLRTSGLNPIVAWLAPATGTYYLRVVGYNNVQTGPYTMQVRLLEGGHTTNPAGTHQIIFIDFDGATIDALALFGAGSANAVLSPLSSFLPLWGLANNAANRDAVIDGVMAKVAQNLEEMRATHPDLVYELRNSRDHADTFGQRNVSRVIVGGTQQQLLIGTIGLAESIDPGNFVREETAVVLLDILSSPLFEIACQNIEREVGVSIVETITRGVGNIAAHEIGHLLGAWHTDPDNFTACIIDTGGGLFRRNIYDTGPDEVIGTPDDAESAFRTDLYAFEGIGEVGSIQHAGLRIGEALRLGEACPGDLSGDGEIDGADLGLMLGAWGSPGPSDLNGDGVTDGADLGLLLGAWGAC